MRHFLLFYVFLFSVSAGAESLSLRLGDDVDLSVSQYRAQGDSLYIWLPSESGLPESVHSISKKLVENNIEVWVADVLDALFLPVADSSIPQVPASLIKNIIEEAYKQTNKKIYLIAQGRGAILALQGARALQLENKNINFGVVLLSPKFYKQTPHPGETPQLVSVVNATNLPIYIVQPDQSPWRWKLKDTVPALEKSGSDVFVQLLKNSRDRFYFRPDAVEREKQLAGVLHLVLANAKRQLDLVNTKARAPAQSIKGEFSLAAGKEERLLKKYRGDPKPKAFKLLDIRGEQHTIEQYKGKVVLVNFWASWCPPCVHEMPSMEKVYNRYGNKQFEILAINMAEEKKDIQKFLKTKVNVSFPILMDVDGAVLQSWQVFAFPTSFVLDKKGNIRYALFGSVDWNEPKITSVLEMLMNE